MKTANTHPLARPLQNCREEGAGSRLSRTVSRIALAAMLLLAAPLALAQTFPPSLSNTASISPPSGVTNSGASCTGAGRSFSGGVCSSTDTNTLAVSSDLAISKTGTASVNQGGTVTYTIRAWNNGLSGSLAATIADTVPANLTAVSWTCAGTGAGSSCSAASGTGNSINLTANLPVDTGATTTPDTAFVTITVTGTATTPGAITNTATVTAPAGATDPTPGNNSSSANTTIAAQADLAITKGVSNSAPIVGTNVTFTLTVTNNGPAAAAAVTVADLLPNGYTYVSDNSGGAYVPGTGAWTIGALANGASASLQIVATVRATGTYANTATVTSTTGDPTPGNNTSTSTPTPVASADLSIVKGVSNSNPVVGGNVTFTLTVTNNGPSAAAAVSVADLLPSGYTYVSDNGGGAYVPGTGVWTIGALANAASASLQIVATVNASGTYLNSATVSSTTNDPTPANNTGTATTTPVASTDVAISKAGPANVNQGGTVTYNIYVWNNGPSVATGASITDTVPANLTGVSWTCAGTGAGATCGTASGTGNNISLSANLPLDTGVASEPNTVFVTITVTGTATTPGAITNTATVAAPAGANDPTPGNNSSSASTTIAAQADLAIAKGVSNATPIIGTNVTFTLTVTNNGPSAAAAVAVSDLLPAGYTYVSDNSAGAYVPGTGVWTIGSLANGASTALQIVATVNATGPYANTATVSSTTGDPTPGNNTSTSTPVPVASADLVMAKSVNNASPVVGSNVVFTLTVTNNGPSAAAAVSVADLLPSGYSYVSDNGGGAYVPGTGVWTIGSLANGASASLQITASVNATGTYLNSATVSSTTNDPTPANNTGTATTTPSASTDVAISKAGPANVNQGGTVTYNIYVWNNGPSVATGASITDTVPANLTGVSWTCAGTGAGATCGTTSGTGNNISLSANLPVDSGVASEPNTVFVTITVTGTATTPGAITNTATVAAPAGANDPTPGNNSSSASTTIAAQADLAITKGVSNATPIIGTNIVFTLTVSNNGPSDAAAVSVADLLPNGYTYVSDNSGGAYVPGTGVWTIGSLANAASASLQITATVNPTGTYLNTATVSSTTGDPTPGNNTATATTTPAASADLVLVKGVSNATPVVGSNVTFTLTVTNNGPSAAAAVSVDDLLPDGYTYVSDNGAGAYVSGTGVWTIGGLANGASASLQIVATVNATGTYLNTAVVGSPTNDPTPANNTGTATTTPTASADLAIRKVGTANVNQGGTVTYTILAWNNGLSAISGATVDDTVPTNLTGVSWTCVGTGSANCASAAGVGNPSIAVDLPVDTGVASEPNTEFVTITVTGTATTPGSITNTATVSVPAGAVDPTPGNDSSSANTDIAAQADLAIVKGVSNASPVVGTTVVFTLTVTNNGPSAAAAVSVADLLPNGYTYVSDNSGGAYVPGTGVWTIGTLADAASASLQITATVNPTGTYLNTATVGSTTGDPNPANNTGSATTTPVASTDLAIVKGVSNASPAVGDQITFTLTVTNNGPSAATGVAVADPLPAGYAYVSDDSSGAYVPGTGAWTIGNLASGASAALNIVVAVNAAGPYANTATVTSSTNDPTPGNNTSTSTPGPIPTADLAIVKGVSNANPIVGTNVVFTLTVTNNGPSPAAAVSVADLLPNGYTYVSDNSAGAYVPGTGVWTIGALANAASASLQITATVNATGTYLNTATVSSTTDDPTPGNNTGTATTTPTASADLVMAKSVDNALPVVGTNVVFTLTVTNNGPSAAAAVSVADLLPNGYTYVSDNSAGAYVPGTGVWTIGALANAASASLQITASVNATGTYVNTAAVSSTTNDPTPGNNTGTATTTPTASADLVMAKSVDNALPVVGTNVVFTLTVTNNGPSAAAAVSVADLLPNGYTYVSDNGAGAYVSGTGVWTVGTLANGASASLQITASVNATGTYINTATVSSTTSDPTSANNTGTATTTPVASADLVMAKSVSNATPTVGTNVVFTLTVTNNGPSASAGVSVADLLPNGYTYVSDNGAGAYVSGTGVWTVGTLANGASASLQITATVNASGTYLNTATASSTTTDPTPANNTGTATTTPVASADLSIDKDDAGASVVPGNNVVYTITVANAGPSAASSITVSDAIPAGLSFVSANGAGWSCVDNAGTVECSRPTLAAGANAAITLTLAVPANYGGASTISNTASVGSATADPNSGNDSDTETTPVSISIDAVDDPAAVLPFAGGTVPNVTVNDTTNGVAVAIGVNATAPTIVSNGGLTGLIANPDGSFTVPASSAPGAYTVSYRICTLPATSPATCDDANVPVVVGPDAVDDTATTPQNTTLNATVTGGDSAPVGSAYTLVTGTSNGTLTFNADGTYTYVPNANYSGPDSFSYRLCLPAPNGSVCDTATVSITVGGNTVTPVDDSASTPQNTPVGINVIGNDTTTGAPLNPASVSIVTAPTNGSVTCDSAGLCTYTPNTGFSGSDSFVYRVCDVSTPTPVCANATATITVAQAVIVANDDDYSGSPVNGASGSANVGNALSNDSLNGGAIDLAFVSLTVNDPNPGDGVAVAADGTVSVAPGTPAGSYVIPYQLCETARPSNCDTASITVVVNAAPINAVDDPVATPVNGSTGGTAVVNVLGNDTLNGGAATTSNVTLAPVTSGPLTVNADGTVDVAPNTPAGTYTVTYQICEVLNPSNCDTATVTVTVNAAPIDAVDDTVATPVNGTTGGTGVVNVLGNDTLNGAAAITANVTLAPVTNGPLTVNANGTVDVAPNTPAGTYTATYRICEVLNPSNCDTAIVTVTVNAAPIDAIDDTVATPVNGSTGASGVINVLGNDTLNGSTLNPADVSLTPVTSGPLTVNANGTVDVAPNTPAGTYTVTYRICEVLNPSNCDTAVVTVTVVAPAIAAIDDLVGGGNGITPQNTPLVTNVLGNDTLNGAPIDPALVNITIASNPANGTVVVNSNGTVTYTPNPNFSGNDSYTYTICEKLNPANCATATVSVLVQPNLVVATDDVVTTNQQTPVAISVLGNDTVTSAPLDPASVSVTVAPTNGAVNCAAGVCTYTPNQFFAGTDSFSYRVCDTSVPTPVCDTAVVTITVNANAPVLRLSKQSAQRSVKIGDLVRYTVIAENVGDSPARNATLVDTPPAGFTYVDGSLSVDDEDNAASVGGTNPLRINGIDVAIGQRATIVYFLRVGAGVGKGVHSNSVTALDVNGTSIGNVATADVDMAGDPLLEDSLIMGTVYDDRDGDGWQDPAKAGGVRVQGGFAPGAYVAGSTTVDRGAGPQPLPDASAPLLHGIAIGDIAGRSSSADGAQRRQVVVRQTLRSLDFSDDFVLTTDEGSTVRMNAAGQTTIERARGDAAKGLTAQDLQVTRQVSQRADGYEVSYTIRNEGIDERGIPGVRIASVEGLIMQTDAYGRYHLEGISGGDAARGRNFILKVDQATLPPGTVFTTENPRVRRVTQGVPTRFDFGVKLPAGEIRGGGSQTDVELGEVMFEAGSDQVKSDYAPMFGKIAQRLREADGGSVTIAAQAEGEALAFARAHAVRAALSKELEPALAEKVRIDVVAGTDASALISLDQAIKLGELLFDTDQDTIRPQYRGLISEIAKTLNREGRGVIGIVGRADPRGANAYNVQLGLRRAKAVFEAISAELEPKVRQKVRVDITDDTNAPVGVDGR
ncbi:Ig-like domain-containing protein [Lysobacter sp. CCNWLW3]|uniref:Ig-like domain-containing protein n=1 Tax=unclassified Lysobacter TaxID=2635362 RepID=UPI002FD1C0E5